MSALIPVLVETDGTEVRVQELAVTPDGVALNPLSSFFLLGTVKQGHKEGARGQVRAWEWSSEGYRGHAGSKAAAIHAMLYDAGYEEKPLSATIPDLLGGWEG